MLKIMKKRDLKTFALPYRGQNPGAVKLTRKDLVSLFTKGLMLELIFLCLVSVLDMTMTLRTRSHLFMADTVDIPY